LTIFDHPSPIFHLGYLGQVSQHSTMPQPISFFRLLAVGAATAALVACAGTSSSPNTSQATLTTQKQQVVDFLKAIETSEAGPVAVVSPNKYIQHNLGAADGLAGFGVLLQALPKGSAKVNTLRVYQDGDYVFTHTDYNFFGPKIGFDVFRFENGKIVEHWDTIETIPPRSEWKNANGKF
jgi:predicted SnoaL-like aldol condensation-catalyzing enzyme